MAIDCPHVDTMTAVPDGGDVCPTCVAMGSSWVNLRQCLACGQVGCCDSSPNTHATKHHEATGHPLHHAGPGLDVVLLDELQFRMVDGDYLAVDPFFEAGLWFIGQHLEGGGTLADVAPDLVVGDGFPLGGWLETFRDRGGRNNLRADERAALESVPGWSW